MRVPVVDVGVVRTDVADRVVDVGMRVLLLLGGAAPMPVPMVLVVGMAVGVRQGRVIVLMDMPLGKVQPHANAR